MRNGLEGTLLPVLPAARTSIDARGEIVDVRRMKKPLRGATLALIAVSPFAHLA